MKKTKAPIQITIRLSPEAEKYVEQRRLTDGTGRSTDWRERFSRSHIIDRALTRYMELCERLLDIERLTAEQWNQLAKHAGWTSTPETPDQPPPPAEFHVLEPAEKIAALDAAEWIYSKRAKNRK